MKDSKIEWTDHTFNPWIGCTKVSPGCANCYAETLMDSRYGRASWGKGKKRVRTSEAYWKQPIAWNRAAEGLSLQTRPRVFCASLADVFDPEVSVQWRRDLYALIAKTPNLDWLLLTKRPQVIAADSANLLLWGQMPNVWLGVSAEDQEGYEQRVAILKTIRARVRFISAEPLLGPINIGSVPFRPDWIIVGGESGHGARAMDPGWARSLRDECRKYNVPFHFKQWGGVNKRVTGRVLDGRTWEELPRV